MIKNPYVNQAIDYILTHINDHPSVEEIARNCNFSKYYFSRMFKMETGESIYEFVKRVKMEQSAFRIKVERGRKVTDISCDFGYSTSNFSSAFRDHHHLSPIEFRRCIYRKSMLNPIFQNQAFTLEPFFLCDQKVSIQTFEDMPVLYRRYIGSYANLSAHWGEFQKTYQAYIGEDTLFLERTYDDPCITDVNQCLYDICITVPETVKDKQRGMIKGGKFAVYHFHAHVEQIYHAYQSFFQVWLPKSGRIIDDRFGFEIYREIDCDTMIMKIDLCFPIQ